MISVNDIKLDNDITGAYFQCNLIKCKGACCTFRSEYGAPLQAYEIELIAECVNAASNYLSENSKAVLSSKGFYEIINEEYLTVCIDKQDCIFVYYEDKIAKCSLEKAYFNGETNFRKPTSCHLFPIRVGNNGTEYLYYEKISECKPGIEYGIHHKTMLIDSVKDALIRLYGQGWFDLLKSRINALESL